MLLVCPLLAAAVLLLGTWLVDRHESRQIQVETQAQADLLCGQLARRLEMLMSQELGHIGRLRDYIESGRVANPVRFFAAAQLMQQNASMIERALWIDQNGVCQGAYPVAAQVEHLGRRFTPGSHWGVLGKSSPTRQIAIEGCAGAESTLCVEAWIGSVSDRADRRGVVLARANLKRGIAQVLDLPTLRWVIIDVRDDAGMQLFGDPSGAQQAAGHASRNEMRVLGETWTLTGWPAQALRARVAERIESYVWLVGCLLSLVAAVGVHQFIQHRRRWESLRGAHERVLQSLNELSAATLSKRESPSRTLSRLTRLFADSLECTGSCLLFYRPRTDEMIRVHREGFRWEMGSTHVSLSKLPITQRCFRTGEIYVVEDADRDCGLFQPGFLQERGIRSFMLVPLRLADRPIGAIQLADSRPHRVGAAERRMAEVWASHAAVLVSHRRLHRSAIRQHQRRRRLLAQTRRLYEISEAIFRATTLQSTLDRICELGPQTIEMDYCSVNLCTDEPNHVMLSATTHRDRATTVGRVFNIEGYHAEDVMRERKVVSVDRLSDDPKVYKAVRTILGTEGVIYAPLCGAGDAPAFGYVVFGRDRGGPFSRTQLRLARIFADRAAAAIEIAQFHEHSAREAVQRQTLLRELNHRVKNNLAGIVGLLSTHPTDLSPELRRWLARITDRIVTMARVHELFVQGDLGLPLAVLVGQVLESLEVVRAQGITFETDLQAADVPIEPDRAVTLAIILNELCYNAIVHGLAGGGTLRVVARQGPDDRMIIEVVDVRCEHESGGLSGAAPAVMLTRAAPTVRSAAPGVGLALVRALVGRELHGVFTLEHRDYGTTVASVEFPR